MRTSAFIAIASMTLSALAAPGIQVARAYAETDGAFVGVEAADGTITYEYRGDMLVKRDDSGISLAPRAGHDGVGCDNIGLDPFEASKAAEGLKDFCARYPEDCRQRTAFYRKGSAVAFFCYWRGNAKWDANSFDNALKLVQDQCANNQGGSFSDSKSEDSRNYSYGWTDWEKHSYCNIPAGHKP